jgi:hypothetical protein
MKPWIVMCALVVLACGKAIAGDDSPQLRFQKGLNLEAADADFKQAAAVYAEVVVKHGDDQALAAQALYRQGLCFERLGRPDDAAACFLTLSESYPGEIKGIYGAADKIEELKTPRKDAQAQAEADKKKPVTIELHLVDGSYIVGEAKPRSMEVATTYGKLDLPLCYVRDVVVDREHETVSASMQDGTTVTGTSGLTTLGVVTEFGEIAVLLQTIDRFGVRPNVKALPAELTQDLLLYYSFERDEGGKVTDASGKMNNGEVDGAKWAPEGKSGGAYEFDGQRSCIRVRDDATLNPKERLTLSAWVKIKAYGQTFPAIISKGNIGNYKESYGLYVSADGQSEFLVNGDGTAGGRTELYGPRVPLDVWTHVAATFDGRVMRLYIDGTECATSPQMDGKYHAPAGWKYRMPPKQSAVHAGGIFASSNPLLIGKADRDGAGHPTTFFNGLIDDVMVYSRALTAEEIGNLYRAGGGQADGKPGEQKVSVPGNRSADAGEVVKGQRYWFEASGLVGINVGGPNGGPVHKADPDGRAISQTDGTVTAPNPADARFPCPGLATHSLVGRIVGVSGAQPSRPSGNPPAAKPALMEGKSGIIGEGEPSGLGVSDNGAALDYVQLGSKGSFVAPASGRLTLQCNDLIPGDNSGAWEVRINR